MKKVINSMLAVVMIAATTLILTSCGDKDNDEPQPTTPTPVSAKIIQVLTVNDALLDIYDINVTTTDATGNETTTKLTQPAFTNTITGSIPTETTMSVNFALKQEPTDAFDVQISLESSATTFDAKGTVVNAKTEGQNKNLTGVRADKAADLAQSLNKTYASIHIVVDTDGTISFE